MSQFLTFCLVAMISFASQASENSFHVQKRGTETWVQLKFNPVLSAAAADILFVIDDSGSMGSHQQNLSKNLEAFLNAVPQTYLQVGVITTSANESSFYPKHKPGHLINGIHKSSDPLFVEKLKKTLLVGTSGDASEQPFASLSLALSEPLISTVNAGFLRPNADLYIVFLTDTQDQSKMDETELYNQIKTLKVQQPITTLAAMVLKKDSTCPGETGEIEKIPPKIQNFVGLTGGSVFSICDDFSKSLADAIKVSVITENTLTLVGTENLKKPVFSTIQVEINGKSFYPGDIITGWTYNSSTQTVTFSDFMISESVSFGPIHVNYQVK